MDEIKIKALIDAGESAKTIQELKKALRDLKSAAVEVGEGSKYFDQITAAAGGVSDRIGDLNAQVKSLGDDLFKLKGVIQIGQGIAAGFAIAQGAAALFGQENEAVQQSIMKLQAAMSILQGVQSVGEILQKESTATLLIQNTYRSIKVALLGKETTAVASNTVATEASAVAAATDAAAKGAEAVATEAATVAQEGLNTAMKANPIMLVIGAIVAIGAALFAFTKKTEEADEATKALNKSIADMNAKSLIETKTFEASIEALKKMKTGSDERAAAIDKINAQYGTTLKNLTDEEAFLKLVNNQVLNYTTFAKERLQVKINEAKAEDALTKASAKRDELASENKNVKKLRAESAETEKLYQKLKNLSGQEISNMSFVTEEGIALANSLINIKSNIPLAIKQYENYADALLKQNAKFISKETDAEEAARKKKEADDADAKKKEEARRQKELNKKIADNKKANDQILEDQKKFVQDWTDAEKELYQVNVDIQNLNTELLGDTLKSRLDAIDNAANQEINAEKQKYDEILKKHIQVEKEKNEYDVKNSKTKVKTLTEAELRAIVEKNATIIDLQKGLATRQELIIKQSEVEKTKLIKEEEKKRQETLKELTEKTLNTDEYRRFVDFLSLVRQGSTFTKKELKELRKELKDTVIEGTEDKPGLTQVITKKLVVGIERDRMLIKKQIDDVNAIIEQSKDNPALTDYVNQQVKKLAELEAEYMKIGQFGPQIDRFINHFNIPAGQVEGYMKALDQITNANKEYRMSAESVLIPDNLSQELDRLFAFQRGLNAEELKDNKDTLTQLAVIYKAKYSTIVKNEEAITQALGEEFDKQWQAMTDFTKSVMEGDNANGVIINSLLNPDDFASAEEMLVEKFGELGSLYIQQAKLLEQKAKEKGSPIDFQKLITDNPQQIKAPVFKIEPNPNQGEVGFEDIVKIDTEGVKTAAGNLLEDLGKLRENLLEAEQSAYDKYLYEIFRKQEQELILAGDNERKKTKIREKYSGEVEEAELNHQENVLGIEVAFHNKSQEDLAAFGSKRLALIKSQQQKEKDARIKAIEEIVKLEKMVMDIVMQNISQRSAAEDRASQDRYQKSVDLIDAEKKAYDDSIANRTVAEQQKLDIEEEFALRKKQAEDQRKREQNDIAEKQFEAQRNNSLAEIAIQYAVAIAKDWGTLGPFGAPMAVFHGIEAGLAAALVLSQKFVPQYADGGLVMGPGGPKDDKINAKLSNGESVINAKSTKMFAPLLSAINQAGGGKPIPHLSQGGIYMPPEASVQNVAVVNNSPMISLDPSSVQAISNAVSKQTISVQENTISNAQAKVAKVESRTKF